MIENKEALSAAARGFQDGRLWPEALRVEHAHRARCERAKRPRAWGLETTTANIHRNCGYLCGQPGAIRRRGPNRRGLEQIAQSLGRQNALKINGLSVCDGLMTGNMGVCAKRRAVVEFSTVASTGFAGD
jgi:hypothetical protein